MFAILGSVFDYKIDIYKAYSYSIFGRFSFIELWDFTCWVVFEETASGAWTEGQSLGGHPIGGHLQALLPSVSSSHRGEICKMNMSISRKNSDV